MRMFHTLRTVGLRIALRSLGLPLVAVLLVQCTAPISVRIEKPVPPVGAPVRANDRGRQLAVVQSAYQRILAGDHSAIPMYNYEVARLIENLERTGVNPWSAPVSIVGDSGIRQLVGRLPVGLLPHQDHFIPTDTLAFKGEDAVFPSIVRGIGAPVVAVSTAQNFAQLSRQIHRKKLPVRNLTAIVRFKNDTATIELIDPYQTESIDLVGRRWPLAADYGAAVMLALSRGRVDKLGIVRLLRPFHYDDTIHLNFLQPYDPKRIPVVLIHGLDSTPATFAPMFFKLLEDPEIRAHYQFWVFSYPSGYPYPYSASVLRKELDRVDREFPDHRDMVVIGHSMGSMISRLLVTDPGDQIWRDIFGKSVAETKISGASRQILEDSVVFRARDNISRVVFISGPLRGSDLATNWFGRYFAKLVRLPATMADIRDAAISSVVDPAARGITKFPNSMDTLRPNNYFVQEVNKFPIEEDVIYHTIAGDRGRGDAPNSSDGVVPYWSSHLDGAASEKIVPSGHSAHRNPEGIQEVRRILLLHLKSL